METPTVVADLATVEHAGPPVRGLLNVLIHTRSARRTAAGLAQMESLGARVRSPHLAATPVTSNANPAGGHALGARSFLMCTARGST